MRHAVLVLLCLCLSAGADESVRAFQRLEAALADRKLEFAAPDARVERLGREMTQHQRRRPLAWRYLVVQSPAPNAGCTGEGVLYVTSGLLALNLDDDELAGILAHEIAHGLLRHVEANLWQQERAEETRLEREEVLRQAEILVSDHAQGKVGEEDFQNRQKELVEKARQLRRRIDALRVEAYHASETCQKQEHEADQLGLQLARRAGFQPDGLLRALRKIQDSESEGAELGGFTHPPLEERVIRLQEILDH